ncbi:MAG: FAD:protein FMN transferase [Phycisphaerales bacterium]|nr:FAD:protein FMN transferase [Phycisphaerales bacterium]
MILVFVVATAVTAIVTIRLTGPHGSVEGSSDVFATFTEEIMSTPITVLVPVEVGAEAARIVFDVFRDVDARMSEWKPTSPLSAVNAAAGQEPAVVPEDLRTVIRRGVEIGEITDGAFDITWAALWGLWDFKAERPSVPKREEIEERLALIDFRRVVIDDAAGTVFLPEAGMVLGLGGIAKGHALDRAATALREQGIGRFLISAGGQVIIGGERSEQRLWRVGIRDPRGDEGDYFASLEITDTSVSTSGDYERYFILDGVRYHHILDPRTGRPARGLRSATVICPDATLADALSTALLILGADRALALVERLDHVEAVLVDDDAGVHVTTGLEGTLRLHHPPQP